MFGCRLAKAYGSATAEGTDVQAEVTWSGCLVMERKRNWTLACVRETVIMVLSHWGRVTHICVSALTTIGSDNGLAPGRRQTIIWTNDGILLIWYLETWFNEILIEIHIFSFKKIHFKMSSGQWRPCCVDSNVLKNNRIIYGLEWRKLMCSLSYHSGDYLTGHEVTR